MKHTRSWRAAVLVSMAALWSGRALAAQSCNQIELASDSEASVSVLLPDTADHPTPVLQVRDARKAAPFDPWGSCPTAPPFGACAPAAHGGTATLGTRLILDPADGMRLVGFHLKNGAKAPTRDVRLCVKYGSE